MKIRKPLVGAVGLVAVASLIGLGAGAAYTDGATATQNVNVGLFGCALTSTDTNMQITNNGHTATLNWDSVNPITGSGASSRYSNITVNNTGSMPETVHWTEATSGSIAWQPSGRMGYTIGLNGNLMSTDLVLAPGTNHPYDSIGFQWAELANADLGTSATIAYTATCGEVPPLVAGNISFVGTANMAFVAPPATTEVNCPDSMYLWISANANQWCGDGTFPVASTTAFPSIGQLSVTASGGAAVVAYTGKTATTFTGLTNVSGTGYVTPGAAVKGAAATLALPVGSQSGDTALVMTYGATSGNNPQVPAGYVSIVNSAGAGNMQTDLSSRTLVAGDNVVPGTTTGYGEEVAVYRGVASIGAHTYNGGNVNNVGGSAYPLFCSALALTKTDGSSWVACMGGDGATGTNANAMVFDANTTNRSSGNASTATGLADTNKGVAAWAQVGWPGDNFPLPGSHGVVVHSIELVSK
jgi:hypothetical protein